MVVQTRKLIFKVLRSCSAQQLACADEVIVLPRITNILHEFFGRSEIGQRLPASIFGPERFEINQRLFRQIEHQDVRVGHGYLVRGIESDWEEHESHISKLAFFQSGPKFLRHTVPILEPLTFLCPDGDVRTECVLAHQLIPDVVHLCKVMHDQVVEIMFVYLLVVDLLQRATDTIRSSYGPWVTRDRVHDSILICFSGPFSRVRFGDLDHLSFAFYHL